MIFYKAVRIEDDKKLSIAIGNSSAKKYTIEYKPNEWIHAVEGTAGIFIFSDLNHAKIFARNESDHAEIWECEVVDPQEIKQICAFFTDDAITTFWERISSNKDFSVFSCSAPAYSNVSKSVKLTKLIYKLKNGKEVPLEVSEENA